MELSTQASWEDISEEDDGLSLCLQDIKIPTDSLLCNKCFTYIFSLINTIILEGKINLFTDEEN